MKKIFVWMAWVGFAVMAACSTEENEPALPAPPATLTLAGETMHVAPEGGTCTMAYTLENPKEGLSVEASTEAEWITELDWSTPGSISFRVEANPASQPRSAVVMVTYDQKEYPFTVNQEEFKVVYEAPHTYALSFGGGDFQIQLGPSNHLVNYDLIPNSSYYTFNIFTDPNNLPTNPKCYDLPAGIYTIDPNNSGTVGTAYANETSFLLRTDENNETSVISFTEGTITIDDTGIKAEVVTEDGIKHVVTGGKHLHESSSTIHEDMNILFDAETTEVTVTYKGDYYDYSYQGAKANYEVELRDVKNLAMVSLDLVSDDDSLGANGIPSGTYPVFQPSYSEPFSGNATIPGSMYGLSYVYPSFAAYFDTEGQLTGVSILAGGQVIITANEDATYTIEIAAQNDAHEAYAVTASWTGKIEIVDDTTPSEDDSPLPPVPPAPPLP